jgi:hypothetical protein
MQRAIRELWRMIETEGLADDLRVVGTRDGAKHLIVRVANAAGEETRFSLSRGPDPLRSASGRNLIALRQDLHRLARRKRVAS